MSIFRWLKPVFVVAAVLWIASTTEVRGQGDANELGNGIRPFWEILSGQKSEFHLVGKGTFQIEGKPQEVSMRLERFDDQSFDLELTHRDYAVSIRRRSNVTALALPLHKVVFVGEGTVDENDQLSPNGIVKHLVSDGTSLAQAGPFLAITDSSQVAGIIQALTGVKKVDNGNWKVGSNATFQFGNSPTSLRISSGNDGGEIRVEPTGKAVAATDWPGLKQVSIPRVELEQQLSRGVRRALEILAPSPLLTKPARINKKVPHGELRWIEGHRVAILQGSPEEIGNAHGELLRDESLRCVDSVINTFGTVETIRSGRWFRQDLSAAFARLAPFIPEDHRREMNGLAVSLKLDPKFVEVANVFPEMFHCSGFAVFGKATRDGKLYHGRVLDYMTTIGLQDSATTFIVAVNGKIPFANVGYGGFIGSVSGMNAEAISLGEMGGRGEGNWDGIPMATLMRRALEECSTLESVMELWRKGPRTCEYFYVFADGKTNQAVGVAAVPEKIEFIAPGQSDPRLGDGIEDAVVLSAGSRLATLRERVTSRYGQIDADIAQWLMSRPVAMNSNLHNVLFVPADRVLYVANADHRRPAADCPYVRLDLRELLKSASRDVATNTSVSP